MPVFFDRTHRINGHTRHVAKKNIHLKNYSMPVFLDWTHRINGHTRNMAKKNIHLKNYSMHVFLDWIDRTNGHTGHMAKQISIQKVLHISFRFGHTRQMDKQDKTYLF